MPSLIGNWRKLHSEKRYREGYDYAAGALLRGEETAKTLSNYLLEAHAFNQHNIFDRGVEDAMLKLIRLKAIEDDRD